jgi:hypothetical protein
MKHRELAVSRRMNVEFDDVGPGCKAGSHRIDRVLQILMGWRQHSRCRTGFVLQLAFVEALGNAAMCQQDRFAFPMAGEMVGVVDVDGCGEDDDRRRSIFEFLVQGLPPRRRRIR